MTTAQRPRVVQAQRSQIEWRSVDLDSLIDADHPARIVWAMVEKLDLTAFYAEIRARGAHPGRPATDPKVLLALWLYATTDGVGSARELERLCVEAHAYRWICGGVTTNYHTLSDFRIEHGDKLDQLMVQALAAMTHQGLVTLERVAHDGMRVRADAGAASFRREATLQEHQAAARNQVAVLRQGLEEDPGAKLRAQTAAKLRAAEDRQARLNRALAEMPAVVEVKRRHRGRKGKKASTPRVSTTDPEARVMKMPDGGFRPGYNVQLATDAASRVIVSVRVTNEGSDLRQLTPTLDDILRRTGRLPGEHLVDGGFVNLVAMTAAAARGVTIYAPPMNPAKPRPAGAPRKTTDSPAVAQWRRRMERTDAKQIYKQRAATAETVNADLRRWRTLDRMPVRGLAKVRNHVLLNALAYNLLRWDDLTAV
jgi:transposase